MILSLFRRSWWSSRMFASLTEPAQLRLDYDTTILPPKKALLPQEETLFRFKTDGSFSAVPVLDHRPRVVFRPPAYGGRISAGRVH